MPLQRAIAHPTPKVPFQSSTLNASGNSAGSTAGRPCASLRSARLSHLGNNVDKEMVLRLPRSRGPMVRQCVGLSGPRRSTPRRWVPKKPDNALVPSIVPDASVTNATAPRPNGCCWGCWSKEAKGEACSSRHRAVPVAKVKPRESTMTAPPLETLRERDRLRHSRRQPGFRERFHEASQPPTLLKRLFFYFQ